MSAKLPSDGPSGIGGWLMLPAVGLVIVPILTAVTLAVALPQIIALLPDPELSANFRAALLVDTVVTVGFLAFLVFTAIAFFSKKPFLPRLMVTLLIVQVALALVNVAIWEDFASDSELAGVLVRDIVGSCVSAAIWIPYFLVSKRVKNTFLMGLLDDMRGIYCMDERSAET